MHFFLIILLLFIFYLYSTRNHGYWKKRGIKYEKTLPLFGGSLNQKIEKVNFSQRFVKLYRQYPNEKFVGFFEGNIQGLLVRDPELIKHILITDFKSFHYRGAYYHKEVTEPLMKNLITVDGDMWKLLRQKLAPIFITGKLKAMFPLIVERAEKLLKIVDGLAKTGDEVDARDLMARYSIDIIGACVFGINDDALNDDYSDFRKLGKRIFAITKRNIFVHTIKVIAPDLFKNVHFIAPEVENQTIGLVKRIVAQQNSKPIVKNSFIDLLLELQRQGNIVGKSINKHNPDGSFAKVELQFDDELLAAQVFVFFAAGFETSSSASSFLLHLLAYHPDRQIHCQKEIDNVLNKYDGKLCYDAVKEMKYLEMAFKESMRLLPSPGFLIRRSVTKYTFPGTNLTIDPDTGIMISLEALNYDEQYFEDPEEFRPERFHPDNIDKIKKCVYMPFGDGPRSCIGYGGRVTDSLIFEDCGILQTLPEGSAVLADRGLKNIAHLLQQNRHTLIRPPSVSTKAKPTKKEVLETKKIAAYFYSYTSEMYIIFPENLGLMQSLAGVASVLSKYSVIPSKNSVEKPRIDPNSGAVKTIIGGLPLSFKRR